MKKDFELRSKSKDKSVLRVYPKNDFNPAVMIKIYTPLKHELYLDQRECRQLANTILKLLKPKKKTK
jgi:hypothetical protein